MAECFYCGAEGKLTRAHLFQQEFREAVQRQGNEPERVAMAASSVTEGDTGVYRDIAFAGDVRNTNVTSLCGQCNAVWMNNIETAAAPAFAKIMARPEFPKPADLFKIAHWSVVVGALSSETVPRLNILESHRRAIRYTRTGQPEMFSTHLVFTMDFFPSFKFDLVRLVASEDDTDSAEWCFLLHAGNLVIITASPGLGSRVSRTLKEKQIESVIGAFSSNLAYVPSGVANKPKGEYITPSHQYIDEIKSLILGISSGYAASSNGMQVADLSGGFVPGVAGPSFDYAGHLRDMTDQLDLAYLEGAFPEAN